MGKGIMLPLALLYLTLYCSGAVPGEGSYLPGRTFAWCIQSFTVCPKSHVQLFIVRLLFKK